MGRYYSGDIEGKFWFAVQSSDAPERFGCVPGEANFINYYTRDIDKAEKEVAKIKENLGEWLPKLKHFFSRPGSYNDEMLLKAGFPADKLHHLISEYADLKLGEKIIACLKEQGSCCFEAEL